MKDELTPEQNRAANKAVLWFLLKTFWNGTQHVFMACLMNYIVIMGVTLYLPTAPAVCLFGSVLIGLFIYKRVGSIFARDFDQLENKINSILKK